MSAVHILFPDSTAPKIERYQLAWKLLLDPLTQVDDRAQAKCWLTYRCSDGEIPYADYLTQIKPVTLNLDGLSDGQKARWRVSMGMAAICTEISNTSSNDWVNIAMRLWESCIQSEIGLHQSCLMSFTRLAVILAYERHLQGDTSGARHIIEKTWARYKRACREWDWPMTSFRAMEAIEDMRALQMLQFIGMENGLTRKAVAGWCNPETMVTIGGVKGVPFVRCIARMSRLAADQSRVIFPYPCKTAREAVADYAGGGVFVELGVASGAFAERVLERNRDMRYVGIDAWSDHHNEDEMKRATVLLSRFGKRVEIKRSRFADAVSEFTNESCEVIYVDGYAHTGQDDGRTLREWWPKVKPGGVFAGHDYDEKWPLTVAAVDAFAKSVGLPVEVIKDEPFSSWLIRKPVK